MSESQEKPDFSEKSGFSSREIRKNNNRSFLIMVIFTLVVVGSVLIGLIYGWLAILTALPFLLGGALLILLPWGLLTLIEKWREQMERP
ncbi:MAG: hypothetical protein GY805_30905 [Chloroflexi bacterium]|nr:hypothetical protein [Chloroflexota bacterium]